MCSDGRDRGRGGGDQAGDQRAEEVQPPPQHRHLLRRLHQEVAAGKGKAPRFVLRGGDYVESLMR